MAERGANFNFDPSILSNVLARDSCPNLTMFYLKWTSKAHILMVSSPSTVVHERFGLNRKMDLYWLTSEPF
jgi:hypothetical protein